MIISHSRFVIILLDSLTHGKIFLTDYHGMEEILPIIYNHVLCYMSLIDHLHNEKVCIPCVSHIPAKNGTTLHTTPSYIKGC